ncbi:MATE family efflux transporter [Desulfosporosinus burensis]
MILSKRFKYISFINASFFIYAIIFLKGIFTRRFITPEEYGVFVNTQLLMSYGMYLQLGALNALNFEIPGLIANRDDNKLRQTISSAKGYITILALIFLVITPVFLLLNISPTLKYGYMFTAICLSLSLFVGIGENILRGYQDFGKLSRIMFFKAVSMFIATVILAYYIGYYGLFFGLIIGEILAFFFMFKEIFSFKSIFSLKLMYERISLGFPIFLNGMLWSLFLTTSQTVGFFKLSKVEMGEFSISIMIYGAIMIVPTIVSQIAYPKILVFISRNNNKTLITDFYKDFMEYYNCILTIITVLSLLIMPVLIESILPNYKNGINASMILLLSMFIIGINGIIANIITGYKKAKQLTIHMLIAFLLLILTELLLLDSLGIDAISIALVIAYITYTILNIHYLINKLEISVLIIIKKLCLNFLLCIVPTFFLLYIGTFYLAIFYGIVCILLNVYFMVGEIRRRLDDI